MLRVPGSNGDLFTLKSQGADIRVVYSPLDCLKIAGANSPKRTVTSSYVYRILVVESLGTLRPLHH
jgi:hydrogenase expression/formation protein HypD